MVGIRLKKLFPNRFQLVKFLLGFYNANSHINLICIIKETVIASPALFSGTKQPF
ncbi:MAG: hypothetical protein ALAOOOJD_02472 [bacterium]|nr:hypothetical protein [bacterium]